MNSYAGLTNVDLYSPDQAEALVRVIESASQVRRRHHFFNWSQGLLQAFLPHRVAACAAYQRQRRALAFDTFYSVPLDADLLAALNNAQSPLLRHAVAEWVARGGRCIAIGMAELGLHIGSEPAAALAKAGLGELLVHGVSRPQRLNEVESLFVLAARGDQGWRDEHRLFFELLLPHIHSTYLRVQLHERELGLAAPALPVVRCETSARSLITQREREILGWVREGKSNQEVGELLGISTLTVKNHLQKILRKLGAANRAQAVAQAIHLDLIASNSTPSSG
jgi:transcriptional regulator EpsA